jgi:hypothetical protein
MQCSVTGHFVCRRRFSTGYNDPARSTHARTAQRYARKSTSSRLVASRHSKRPQRAWVFSQGARARPVFQGTVCCICIYWQDEDIAGGGDRQTSNGRGDLSHACAYRALQSCASLRWCVAWRCRAMQGLLREWARVQISRREGGGVACEGGCGWNVYIGVLGSIVCGSAVCAID